MNITTRPTRSTIMRLASLARMTRSTRSTRLARSVDMFNATHKIDDESDKVDDANKYIEDNEVNEIRVNAGSGGADWFLNVIFSCL